MMRSLYAGVSGLQNHQVRMDVLGNNIANVNTTGFKKGRVNFQDMLSQTMSGAAKPNDEVGGVNPKQVGLGMTIATIDTIHTQGAMQTTGVMTDLAVQGEGFFIQKAGDKEFFTRAGAFGLDKDGYLVNPSNGMKIQGWRAETVNGRTIINTATDIQDLLIPVGSKDPALATSQVDLACNLDKRAIVIPADAGADTIRENTWVTSFDVFDSFGRAHKLQVEFTKVPDINNRWKATVRVDPEAATTTNTLADVGNNRNNRDNVFYVNFDNLGALQSVSDGQNDTVRNGQLQVNIGFDVAEANPDATDAVGSRTHRQNFTINIGTVGSYQNSVTQFGEKFSTKIIEQNGYSMGYLETFKIDQSGTITGVFSNGTNRALGQVALANFSNPGGLEKAGENTYVESNNSGAANIGEVGIAGRGKIIAGALEMSNVDLAEQFTDMIVTQRGFQANSRTITTADQLLQELLTLKR